MTRNVKILYLGILGVVFVISTSFWVAGTSASADKEIGRKQLFAFPQPHGAPPSVAALQSEAGALDPSFGSSGLATTDFGAFETVTDIALAPDGTSYYVAGRSSSTEAPKGKIFLARYNADGSLSSGFGSSGKVTQAIGTVGWVNGVGKMAIQSDGKIVVVGTYILDDNQRFLVTRFLDDGSLDTSFNSTGYVIDDFGANAFGQDLLETAMAVAIQTDGSIVAGGAAARPNSSSNVNFALARYTTSGQRDNSFGTNGHVITDLGLSNSNIIRDIVIQPDGKIVVAGGDGKMARYHVNGPLDSNQDSDPGVSFRSTGIVNDHALDNISALAMQPDGKFVVVGFSYRWLRDHTIYRRYSSVRRVNTDGSLDFNFIALRGGFEVDPPPSQNTITDINDLAIYPNGKIVFAGSSSHLDELGFPIFDGFALAVHNFFGGLDTSFGNGGMVITPIEGSDFPFEGFAAAAVQGYDRIVAAGRTTGSDALVAAYHGPHESFALNFSSTAINASETSSAHEVVVTLEGPTAQTVTVDYATSDGTATAGVDYQAVSGSLTFAPGETRKTFDLTITSDSEAEPAETLLLTLSNPVNAVLGAPNPFTLTINDNPRVSFAKAEFFVLEKAGVATISVAVEGGHSLPVTVDYAVTAGTATANSDFTPVSGTLSFAGQGVKTFDVPITADSLDESNETIILTLSNPTNASLDAPNPTTLTIINGPECVECPTVNVSERDGFATVEVHRVTTTESVSVNYTTWDGKAEAGVDYTAVSGTLEFAAGEAVKNIIVPIAHDQIYDPDETFFVTLESSDMIVSDSLIIVRILDASIVVNTTNSSNPGPDDCTLARAIEAANSNVIVGGCEAGTPGVDTIFVPAGTYPLTAINNTDFFGNGDGANALPVITSPIKIVGVGAGQTVIERASNAPEMRIFLVANSLTLDGLTVRGGRGNEGAAARVSGSLNVDNCTISDNVTPAGAFFRRGGAIFGDSGPVTITNSSFVNNVSSSGGGALAVHSLLNVTGSIFVGNTAQTGDGGAVIAGGSPASISNSRFLNNTAQAGGAIKVLTSVTIADSIISGNVALGNTGGGGIYHTSRSLTLLRTTVSNNASTAANGGGITGCGNSSPLAVTDCTISGNTARDGGGICGNNMTLTNTTVSGNSATGSGGGISVQGSTWEFNAVTITNNTADSDRNSDSAGGGVRADGVAGSLRNSIIAGNHEWRGYHDFYTGATSATSRGHNIVGNTEGFNIAPTTGDQFGPPSNPISALLGPLQFNGGPTQTHALLGGSPAIDAADPATPGSGDNSAPATDQRGRPRASASNTRADIGAFEISTTTGADLSLVKNGSPAVAYLGRQVSYTLHATNSGTVPLDFVAITDHLPNGLNYVSSSTTQGSCIQTSNVVTCDLGTLGPDTTAVVTIITSATATGVHVNTAQATTNTPESDLSNNAALAVSSVKLPITVNTITQESGFASDCTLSQAIEAANSDSPVGGCIAGNGADIIILPAGIYTLDFAPYSASGQPVGLTLISSDIQIEGAGASTTVIRRDPAAPEFRILHLNHSPQGTLTLSNLTITNGRAPSGPGGGIANTNGSGPLAINDCVFSNNTTVNGGGGAINMVGAPVTINNGTFMNNVAGGSWHGGAIHMAGAFTASDVPVLTVSHSSFSSNSAGGTGGAIKGNVLEITGTTFNANTASSGGAVSGTLMNVADSLVSGNQANAGSSASGGGFSYITLSLTRSTISGNQSTANGGGLHGTSTTIIDSTVSNNTAAGDGGGVRGGNHVSISNSTISGNSAGASGGGISLQGALFLNNATITNNTADSTNNGAGHAGGGIRADGSSGSIKNSIIAGNHEFRGSLDLYTGATSLVSQGYNLIGDNSGCNIAPAAGDLFGTQSSPINPLLGPLQNNGGPTQTHALLANSPAIDAANPATPDGTGSACLPTDQRGAHRPEDGNADDAARCDIGAFELAEPASPSVDVAVSVSDTPDPATVGSPLTYTITVTNAGPSTATGVNVTDTLASGLSFISAASSQGTFTHPGNTLIFNLGSLAKDATATISIIVTPIAPGSIDNTASVTANESDGNVANNSATTNTSASQSEVLSITRITPNRGGNVGPVVARVIGSGIDQGATLKLVRAGHADIPGQSASAATNGLSIGAIFDLTGQAAGAWDVWVVNPDGQTATLDGAFTVEVGQEPEIWSDIVGPAGVRAGQEASYSIVYGNHGNVDAFGVFLEVSFAKGVTYRLNFDTQEPTQVPGKEIDLSLIPDHIESGERTIVSLYIPYVRSGGTHTLRFLLTVPPGVALPDGQVKLKVRHTDPIFIYMPAGGSSAGSQKGPGIRLTPSDGGGCGSIDLGLSPDAQDCILNFLGSVVECLGTLAPPGTPANCILALVTYLGGLAGDVCQFLNSPDTPKIVIGSKLVSSAINFLLDCVGVSSGWFDADKVIACLASLYNVVDSCGKFFRPGKQANVPVIASYDPNDKMGANGVGAGRFISGQPPFPYVIHFENLSTASAPAQVVTVTDQLDPSKVALSTLAFGPVTFGDQYIDPPAGATNFVTDVDLRPGHDLILRVEGHANLGTGVLTWTFSSLDPSTGQLTNNPFEGFLPPNVTAPEGEGSVSFFVQPADNLVTGTEITNGASIVFDTNAPINTPSWLNTIDNAGPASQVSPLAAQQFNPNFTVQWQGSDAGSGLASFTIYVSENGGPYSAWLTTNQTSATYHGQGNKTYSFYSVAEDAAGNVEAVPLTADATTTVSASPTAAPGTISGRITTTEGVAVEGVTITLNGGQESFTVTDNQGNYSFANVQTENFYVVTPSRVNFTFSPASRSFSLIGNTTDATFSAIPSAGQPGNPLDTTEYFVRQHYLDFLGREPDAAGLVFWSNQIRECGVDPACFERRRINVSAAYFLSIEFQGTGGVVDGLYRASYGRRPLYAEFMPDVAAMAEGVVVGTNGWEQKLAANKREFIQLFVNRTVFRTAFDQLSNETYVNTLMSNTRVSFSQAEREALVGSLNNGTATRADVLIRIAENEGFVRAKRNEAFVMMEYFGYLRRDPDESGYQYWLDKLNQFDGDFERAEMVKAFISSAEYRQRFAR